MDNTKIAALVKADDPTIDKRTGEPKKISRKVAQALQYLARRECKTIKQAAEKAGLSREHLSRALRAPHIARKIADETALVVNMSRLPAANEMLALLDAQSAHVRAKTAIALLAMNGFQTGDGTTVAVQINNNVQPGYVINLTRRTPAIQAEIEAQTAGFAAAGNLIERGA